MQFNPKSAKKRYRAVNKATVLQGKGGSTGGCRKRKSAGVEKAAPESRNKQSHHQRSQQIQKGGFK